VAEPGSPPAVQLDAAGVQLGGRFIWRWVDLAIQAGEFVAILGPNGAGKSTLLKTLLGVLPLAEGSISVFGTAVRRGNRAIGYLPQRRNFDPDLRVRGLDLVRLGIEGSRWGVPIPFAARLGSNRAQDTARRVAAALEMVGGTAYAGRPIGEMSGGEQQRILIAQALVGGARMLVLDEPLDSLDLPNQGAVAELVARIAHSEQVAVVMVAHDVNPIVRHLDRVIYLAAGSAVIGRPDEVITTEHLSALYGSPIEVLRTSDDRLVVVGAPDRAGH
jgi:zinc/manganese transport system ATP-binding protein